MCMTLRALHSRVREHLSSQVEDASGANILVQDGIVRMRWREHGLEPVGMVHNEIYNVQVGAAMMISKAAKAQKSSSPISPHNLGALLQ